MQLSPLHLSVAKLLDGRLFQIPDYQRAYSWQRRQRQDLFGDIEEAHRSGREHFMATVVALAREKRVIAADELQAVELVDGQQRVTTIVILLKAVEKRLLEPGVRVRHVRNATSAISWSKATITRLYCCRRTTTAATFSPVTCARAKLMKHRSRQPLIGTLWMRCESVRNSSQAGPAKAR